MVQKANAVFRDFVTDGIPSSGEKDPDKVEIRKWGTYIENGLMGATAGATIYDSKSDMAADTSQAANAMAWVLGDPVVANNGIYQFDGTSTWTRLGDLPYSYIKATNTGAGTANAMQATTSVPIPVADGGALIALPIVADNTASPVTVAFNSGAALTIKNVDGQDPQAGDLPEGMIAAGYLSGSTFRLITDPSSVHYRDAAIAAQQAAEDAAEIAENFASDIVSQGNVPIYAAQNDISSLTVPSGVTGIRTNGYAVAGDGGDVEMTKLGAVPVHSLYRLDDTSQVFAITKRTIRASQAGAFPSDTVSQHEKFNAALAYLEDVGGGCLEIDKDEPYLVGGQIQLANFRSHIRVENVAGGIIKAAPTLAVPMIWLGETTDGTVTDGQFTAYGLRLDNSDGSYDVGESSCSGLTLRWLDAVYLHNYQCIGGFDPLVGLTDSGGDSGIGITGCRLVVVNDPDIQGQPDAAIYPSWDNSGNSGGYLEVNGGFYRRNYVVLTAKRNLQEVVWRGGLLTENTSGITTQWVNNGGWVDPARSIIVEGVKIKKTLANAIQIKGNCRAQIFGNVIEDIGYYYDGGGNVGGNARAVSLQGVNGASIKNNRFEMKEWAPVAEYAFSFLNDTVDGTKKGGNHDIGGNTLKNWSRYAVGGSDGDPSIHENEAFIDCPTSNRFPNSIHPNSVISYRNSGDLAKHTSVNGRDIAEGVCAAVIDDDGFYDFGDISPVGFGKVEIFTVGVSPVLVASTIRILTSAAPHISALTGTTTNIDLAATGTPTGTTGADGNISLYAVSGHFYIENRSGGEVVFRVRWETSN